MEAHVADLELQVSGERVLWSMTHNESEDVVVLVLQGGSVQAVLAAANAHPEAKELKQACGAWSRMLESFRSALLHADGYPLRNTGSPDQNVAQNVEEAEEATTTATDDDNDEGI